MMVGHTTAVKKIVTGLKACLMVPLALGLLATGASAQVFISKEREKQIGREQHPLAIAEFGGVYSEKGLDQYIADVGNQIAKFSNDPDLGYTFTLVNFPEVNAFAMPGGYVYVTRGLVATANSEAEMAGTIGHEIGHVTERHMAKRLDRQIGVSIIGVVVGAVGGSDQITQVINRSGQALVRSFSRDQEYEADLVGVRALAAAGYDPFAQADFLDSMAKERAMVAKITGEPYDPNRSDFLSTHPNTGKRVKKAIEEAGRSGAGPAGSKPRNRDIFLDRIEGMLFGDDPEQGFIRGRNFSHPALRMTFNAPERFYLRNSTTSVYAQGPENTGLRLTADRIRSSDDIATYLRKEFASQKRIRLSDVQSFKTRSGLPAATGLYRMRNSNSNYDIRFVAIQYAGSQVYNFMFWAPPEKMKGYEPQFQETVMGFRKLSNAEAAKLKPLRIRIVKAGQNDTVQTMANRMAYRTYKIDRFKFINSIEENEAIVPGRRYKIVAE